VSDRVFRQAFSNSSALSTATKDKRHRLAQIIERDVNQYINDFKEDVEAEVREHRRLQQVREQMEREKRLSEA
jgi:cell division septum initiation protein DivIVA